MKLHEDKDVFLELVQNTSEVLKIQEVFIEKDYWITYVLKTLSEWDNERSIVFKGGTSLSKAYKVIDRFSEDVDLVLKDTNFTNNQIKDQLRKAQKKTVAAPLEEVKTHRTSKGSRFRKIDCVYPKIMSEDSDIEGFSRNLLIEFNSFANPFPSKQMKIESYIAEMLSKIDRGDLITQFELESFNVEVLDFKRTVCEKMMSLLRLSLKNNPVNELRQKIRHFYDISKLLENAEIQKFIKSGDFFETLKAVYKDDVSAVEFKDDWKETKLSLNPLFKDMDNTFRSLEPYFDRSFKSLLFEREDFEFSEIVENFKILKKILDSIDLED